jgi:hypothetical protein
MERGPAHGGEEPPDQGEVNSAPRNQKFVFGAFVFNVDRAQQIVAEDLREVDELQVGPWASFYGLTETATNRASFFAPRSLDQDYAMTTDLERYSKAYVIEKKKSARAASNASW